MLRAIERGLSLRDFEYLTVTQIMDYIITYNNENSEDSEDSERIATQSDFDSF